MAHEHLETYDLDSYSKKMRGFYIHFGSQGKKLKDISLLTPSISKQKSNKSLGLKVSFDSHKKEDQRELIKEQSIERI